MALKIHPTAIIDPKAELDDGVEVQAYTLIGPGVRLGPDCVVGPHCVLVGRSEIGRENQFFSGSQIGILSQDLKHRTGIEGRTQIGDGNMFREHVTVSASTIENDEEEHRVTVIGNKCLFMACTHVAHDCRVGSHVIMANCAVLAGHVTVEDRAIFGGLSGVHQECSVGAYAFIAGLSRVVKDAPPYMIIEGVPAGCYGPNVVGLRRAGMDDEKRKQIKQMYKIVYRSNLNTTQALHEIESTVPESPERNHFLQFFRKSLRGVTTMPK